MIIIYEILNKMWNILLFSLSMIVIVMIYRWILNKICLNGVVITDDNLSISIRLKLKKINENILKENKWLIKPIYYILYYFPTNWWYLTIMWIGRKWWDIRLYINSNKDVVGKKLFEKDWSRKGTIWGMNKYMIWIKENIINIILRILYMPMFFKIIILLPEGFRNKKDIIIITIIGIICSYPKTVIFIIIFISIFYRYIMDFLLKYFIKEQQIIRIKFIIYILEEIQISRYIYVKNYMIFMRLAEIYAFWINEKYNGYLIKNINESNIMLPKNMIKQGIIKYHFKKNEISFLKNEEFNNYNIFLIKMLYMHLKKDDVDIINYYENKIKRYKNIDIIMICEKNYRKSFIMYFGSFPLIAGLYTLRESIFLENYVVCEVLYGEEVVAKYFKEGLEEIMSMFFILYIFDVWINMDEYDLGYLLKIIHTKEKELYKKDMDNMGMYVEINKELKNDIPEEIKSNKEYEKILEIFNFFIYFNYDFTKNIFYNEHYEKYKNSCAINFMVIRDIFRKIEEFFISEKCEEDKYKNDIENFKRFLKKKFPDDTRINPYMPLMCEIFVQLKRNKIYNWREEQAIEIENILTEFKKDKKYKKDILDLIIKLQEEHKKKYFNKTPKQNKYYEFYKKEKIKEQWEFFKIYK